MYLIVILPIASAILAQIIKQFTGGDKFKARGFLSYSGMPSGHSAIVISLATIIGLQQGLSSPAFAISLVLALIIITDAIGLRSYLGEHGKILNVLVKDLREDKLLDAKYPKLLERIGHTPIQAIFGSLLGFVVSLAGYILFS